jgi:transcriptional regulator with XRE-family HTH domain
MPVGIGERIRALRTEHGLSQEEVARRTGVSLGSYGDIERGVTTDPHYSTLRGISHALGVSIDRLLEEEPVPLAEAPDTGQPEDEALQETGSWGREAHGLAPYATPEERRAVLNEVGRGVQLAVGRAEYWDQELERGRTTQYRKASSAENLAILARDEFSSFHRWLGDVVAPGLDAQIDRGLASEIADEYVALMDAFVERLIQTQHALFDHAARVAETQAQQDTLAKLREKADRGMKTRPRSTESA